jgi:hypothetical protein
MANKSRQHTIAINGEMYYTAQKAEEVLSMTYSGLKYQVLVGNIRTEVPKGRRQSYYNAKDVESVAKDLKAVSLYRVKKPTNFRRLKDRGEMEYMAAISQENIARVEEDIVNNRMEILAKNPDTYYILEDDKQILGYTTIWPLKPGKISSILAQSLPIQVNIEDIETFEDGKSIDIYINAIHVKKGFSKEERRLYGARLISGLAEIIENLGNRGILVGTIAARSNTHEGIRLMQGVGFAEIEPLTPDRRTFTINIKESGTPFVMKYKEKLRQWQEEYKRPTHT